MPRLCRVTAGPVAASDGPQSWSVLTGGKSPGVAAGARPSQRGPLRIERRRSPCAYGTTTRMDENGRTGPFISRPAGEPPRWEQRDDWPLSAPARCAAALLGPEAREAQVGAAAKARHRCGPTARPPASADPPAARGPRRCATRRRARSSRSRAVPRGRPHPCVLVLRAPHACHQPAPFASRLDDVAAAQAIGAIVGCVEWIGDAAT